MLAERSGDVEELNTRGDVRGISPNPDLPADMSARIPVVLTGKTLPCVLGGGGGAAGEDVWQVPCALSPPVFINDDPATAVLFPRALMLQLQFTDEKDRDNDNDNGDSNNMYASSNDSEDEGSHAQQQPEQQRKVSFFFRTSGVSQIPV